MSVNNSKNFCILPWIHLNIMPDSSIIPCCISPYEDTYGNGATHSLQEIINSEKFKTLRKNMLNDIPSAGCSRCYKLEATGFRSMRLEMNSTFKESIHLKEKTLPDGSINNFNLKYADIRFSNVCNFKCRGCGPALSHAWYEDHQALYDYKASKAKLIGIANTAPSFWNELKPHILQAEIIYFGGGEPLITKEHYEILTELISKGKTNIKLRYNTNLSHLSFGNFNLAELWSKFDSVDLSISIDDFGKRAEYFRHGTNWQNIENNFKKLMTHFPMVKRNINCTVNIMNVYYLPNIYQHILGLNFVSPNNFRVNLLLDPVEYRIDILPKHFKEKVKIKLLKYRFYIMGLESEYGNIVQDIDNVLKFMFENDLSEKIILFKKTTSKLDALRNENFSATFPELTDLVHPPGGP